jgi:alpha/beta superfamily hydrolase
MARRIESLFLAGPAGRLEALLEEPEDTEPREAALVCHPHPQYGGTMHNKVVYRMARGLRRAGSVVLRFNYRGVNHSEGAYGGGEGELEDARAAWSFLRTRYPGLPGTLAGFSFGSRIVLRLGCAPEGSASARRIIAAGFPIGPGDRTYLDGCTVPRVFIQSTRDEFGPLATFQPQIERLPEPKRVILVDAQDHFFAGALDRLEEVVALLDS